jgi:hypothetical protein
MEYLGHECKYHLVECSMYDESIPEEEPETKKPVKKVKGKDKKKAHKALKKEGKKLAASFDRLKKMTMADLMSESLDTLRDYAGKGLKIVGASKIPGGKTALVSVILKTRG